jgi:hypothetical protein
MSWAILTIFLLFLFDPELLGSRLACLVDAYERHLATKRAPTNTGEKP